MSAPAAYLPNPVFSVEEGEDRNVPQVLIAPARYIQGTNVLDHLGRYLSIVPSRRAAVLISAGGRERQGERLLRSLKAAANDARIVTFQGECSEEEVERVSDLLRAANPAIDCVVAVGGGKCVDAGKCVAHRLNVPAVICPTLASNDAPCSALSVMYSPAGTFTGIEFFPHSPALVVVDTRIVVEAPVRYLVAGMGDAMATWYEARTCLENPAGRSALGARPTRTASALGELCARTLFAEGEAAVAAVGRGEVNEALEQVVEANTLLSGVGFESGGVAVAHSVAQALTVIPAVHSAFLHGEEVAIGLLTQLALEGREDETRQVADFFARVGLPVHLGQILLSPDHDEELRTVMEVAASIPFAANEPFAVTTESLLAACRQADARGREVAATVGDAAYSALHASP